MIGYKSSNNATGLLLSSLGATGTTLILQTNQGDLFPPTYPYFLTVEKIVSEVVTQREIVKVTNKSGDNFTIVRSAGTCPPNDTSTTQGTTAFEFDAGDRVSLYIPAEVIDDLYLGISEKINKSGDTMTGVLELSESSNIASATPDLSNATGNTVHITGTTTITSFGTVTAGTVMNLIFDGVLILTHNGTSLILPTSANITTEVGDVATIESKGSGNWKCLNYQKIDGQALDNSTNINGLTEDTTGDMDSDYLVKYDGSNKKILVNKYRATDGEATAGTVENKFVNPKQVKDNSIIKTNVIVQNIVHDDVAISDLVIPHGLGKIPRLINTVLVTGSTAGLNNGHASYDGSTINQKCYVEDGSPSFEDFLFVRNGTSAPGVEYSKWAISSIDATNITLTHTQIGTWTSATTFTYYISVLG